MASGVWEALQMPATVRIVLTANGHAEVATAASDIGTGTYTIMAQVAADMLGLDRQYQRQARQFDSAAMSAGRRLVDRGFRVHAIANTARAVRGDLLELAKATKDSPALRAPA